MSETPNDDACQVTCVHPEAVARARAQVPTAGIVEHASEILKAVADPTRLRLLTALAAGELCVCDLAVIVGTSESAVSHQLRLLREQRLVAYRKAGRVTYYRLLDAHVTALISSAVEHAQEAAGTELGAA
jgi:DNA-binding transcriptional ArsR family regulator